MKRITLLLLQHIRNVFLVIIVCVVYVSSQAQIRYTTNIPVIKNYTIPSKILNENRKISIYRPEIFPEYASAISPVIYLLDGEAYITFFASIINMTCERLVQLPPITLVSIENYVDSNFSGRYRDFSPLVDTKYPSGGAGKFMRFIQEEVMPFVENGYKKTPYRVVAGHSMSAFFAVHAFLQYPSFFNGYIATSPAMGMNNDAYIRIADSIIKNSDDRDNTLFLAAGDEAWAQVYVGKMDSMLQKKKLKSLLYRTMYYPNETHYTVFLKAFYDGFHFIFRMDPPVTGKQPSQISYQLFQDHYTALSKIFGYDMKPPRDVINYYGNRFLKDWNDIDKSLVFFRNNVENYPGSVDAYNSYGEALLKKGDGEKAIVNYERAFRLDSTNIIARDALKKLRSKKN